MSKVLTKSKHVKLKPYKLDIIGDNSEFQLDLIIRALGTHEIFVSKILSNRDGIIGENIRQTVYNDIKVARSLRNNIKYSLNKLKDANKKK